MNPILAIMGLGAMELFIVGLIVFLLFGSRLPSVMRSLGQSVTSFKGGLEDGEEKAPPEVLDEKKK